MDKLKEPYLNSNPNQNRQLVRLLNGWILLHVFENNVYVTSHLSKNDGNTWEEISITTLRGKNDGSISERDSKGIRNNCGESN